MTRDVAVLTGPDQRWLNTQDFVAKLDENENVAMSWRRVAGPEHQVPPL